ncbi:hypothetical protein B9Y74_12650 [Stenotrophomonas maltophilia]|nr:hypothetical protein B9Y74_12650 [Stenotrophomonas maltophilia]
MFGRACSPAPAVVPAAGRQPRQQQQQQKLAIRGLAGWVRLRGTPYIHSCRLGRAIHGAHAPATGPTPPSTVFRDLMERPWGQIRFPEETGSDPRFISISDRCVDQGRHLPTAHGICRRWGGVGVRGVSRMDAAAKPTGTYLRRPRTPTPPRQTTEYPLLTLTLLEGFGR